MEILILLIMAVVLLWCFGDFVVTLVVRFAGLLLCLWVALRLQYCVAVAVLKLLPDLPPVLAVVTAFVLVFVGCAALFRWLVVQVRRTELTAVQVVGADVVRVGLMLGLVLALLVMLLSMAMGKVIGLPWTWLAVFAAIAACVDTCFPSLISHAVQVPVINLFQSKGTVR